MAAERLAATMSLQINHIKEGPDTCFNAWWVNKNEYSDVDDPIQCSARSESIKRMMHHYKKRMRNVKKRLKIIDFPFWFPKFHEILHLLNDIKQFGVPMNFCEIMDFPFWFPKFHEILHLVLDDITRFDTPMNFCAQRP